MPVPKHPSAEVLSAEDYFGPVTKYLPRVRQRMQAIADTGSKPVNDCISTILNKPGKMIRSGLLLLAGKAMSQRLNAQHVTYAAIVELLHTATLLHDDVIDRASLRRGQLSANALWGNTAAVLLGDAMLSGAFQAALKADNKQANTLLTKTAQQICRGELIQNLQSGNWNLSESEYFEIIDGKTAALFACAASLGGLLSDAEPEIVRKYRQFGFYFGRAFQISDDLLDLVSTDKKMGKPAGIDLARRKPTLPVIHWFGELSRQGRNEAVRRLSGRLEGKWILRELTAAGSLDYTFGVLSECGRKAAQMLKGLPESKAKSQLQKLHLAIQNRV